jgi:hypothetical protein
VRKTIKCFAVALTFSVQANCWAVPQTVSIDASKDVSLFQNNVNNSSGAGNGLIAGTNGNTQPRRSLIEFDIAGNLPANAIVLDVRLDLVLGATAGGGGTGGGPANVTIGLRKLSADWGEGVAQLSNPKTDTLGGQGQGAAAGNGDATWSSNFHNASLWATPGGDFGGVASASLVVGGTLNTTNSWLSTPALVSDVQGWFNNPATNFGWALVNSDEATANTSRTFFSRDVLTPSLRPILNVTYEVIPEPSAAMLVLVGAAAALKLTPPGSRRRLFPH